ncbi:hypothetical protein C7C46_19970 [Streptomyces tateyamensis]|uniref:Uncharacterized protein n=1 Tax=Streptomyces tateyamensis TaxID=565073 RepID=A0A2V4NN28_9ACTN|nr:hypothetical protein C7C46_19970 [Streptomyces tateyamensis]
MLISMIPQIDIGIFDTLEQLQFMQQIIRSNEHLTLTNCASPGFRVVKLDQHVRTRLAIHV